MKGSTVRQSPLPSDNYLDESNREPGAGSSVSRTISKVER